MNLKLLIAFFLLFGLSTGRLVAKTPASDSLRALLNAHPQNDTVRVNLLNKLAKEFRLKQPDSLRSFAEEAHRLAGKLHYLKGEGLALYNLGYYYFVKGDFLEAMNYYNKAQSIFKQLGDPEFLSDTLIQMCVIQQNLGNYPQALTFAFQSLKNATKASKPLLEVDSQMLIGYIYALLGDYAKAFTYQLPALKQAEQLGNLKVLNSALNAVGETYRLQGEYQKSIPYYKRSLEISRGRGDNYNLAIAEGNLAEVYIKLGNYKQGFAYGFKALSFFQYFKDLAGECWQEGLLARAYLQSNQPDSALYYGRQSLSKAQQTGSKEYSRDASQVLMQLYTQQKDYAKAFRYQQLYYAYKDSLTGEETTRRTSVLQYNSDLEKKQTQIVLLTKDKQLQAETAANQRQLVYGLLAGLAFVIVIAGVLIRNNRLKQRANALLEQQKLEIDGQAQRLTRLNEELYTTNDSLAKQTKQVITQRDYLEQSYRNVELLGEIGKQITASLSVETIISTVYQNVNALMDANVFGIGIYNENLQRIDFPATYEKGEKLPFYSNALNDQNRLDVWCFRHNQEVLMGDYFQEYSRYISQIQEPKAGEIAQSVIYLPLVVKNKVIGVITIQSFELNAYSDYHLYILRNLALYTAIALENAYAYQELNQTLVKLTNTQEQLIQQQKMASLGELTAGIAHEIQNPLNFVNNFSEVNTELVEELKLEISKENKNEALELADNLMQNLDKITHHGKRADAIVKGMLQHSRTSTGEMQLTDINTLVDEYLRLCYHGLRSKNKDFNAQLITDFDSTIGKVKVVPQELGRVLLNLFNNAFYAIQQKKTQLNGQYQPEVKVSTCRQNGQIEIKVRDNGTGIPENAQNKIFQPFYTTKPTGQGTGLGLSLSYDIITKGHRGELKVETEAGTFTEFIIILPHAIEAITG